MDIDVAALLEEYPLKVTRSVNARLRDSAEGKALMARLAGDPRVQALAKQQMATGDGYHIFQLFHLGGWFLWYEQQAGWVAAEAALERFLSEDEVEVIFVRWVLGVTVSKPLDLLDNIQLVPASALPETRETDYLTRNQYPTRPFWSRLPEAAVTWRMRISKVAQTDPGARPAIAERAFRLHEITMLLNALEGWCVQPHVGMVCREAHVPFGPFSGYGGGQPLFDVSAKQNSPAGIFPAKIFKALVDAYESRGKEERKMFSLILHRLAQAKRADDLADKVLDIGIIMEMLLLHGRESRRQLAETLRTRGAALLGITPAKRKNIEVKLNRLYELRSNVAHTGSLGEANLPAVRREIAEFEGLACLVFQVRLFVEEMDWKKLVPSEHP
jgi:hypothetical protein